MSHVVKTAVVYYSVLSLSLVSIYLSASRPLYSECAGTHYACAEA
jgi:hypothetical protein